jgi:hypothetical protein
MCAANPDRTEHGFAQPDRVGEPDVIHPAAQGGIDLFEACQARLAGARQPPEMPGKANPFAAFQPPPAGEENEPEKRDALGDRLWVGFGMNRREATWHCGTRQQHLSVPRPC